MFDWKAILLFLIRAIINEGHAQGYWDKHQDIGIAPDSGATPPPPPDPGSVS